MTVSILYPHLPAMPECDGCGDCCGPVSVTDREAKIIADYVAENRPRWRPRRLTCGFYNRASKSCRIYPVRPFSCRLFGVAQEMRCDHYPQAAVLSFPADRSLAEGWIGIDDRFLAELMEERCVTSRTATSGA